MPTGIYKRTKKTKKILSNARKRFYNNGGKHPRGMKGKKQSKKWKDIMKVTKHNWKGGITNDSDYVTWRINNSRRIRAGCVGDHTYEEWKELKLKYNNTCLSCLKDENEVGITIDHIVPLSKNGTNYIENIQPLCKSCNCKKRTKTINYK